MKWPDNFSEFCIEQVETLADPVVGSFVKRNHYSGSLSRGNKACFLLKWNDVLLGVAAFGYPTGIKCRENYSIGSGEILELKRFCLAKKAPKNVSSWFLSRALKALKSNKNLESVLSFSDPRQGHVGTIYKAANFEYFGQQKTKGQAIVMNGEELHLRAAFQKGTKTAEKVKEALKAGTAKYISLPKKDIWLYPLRK